ncbi:MAG TPA: UDP-N-acetylmuramoyl-tripeptide--D-alanyl-D-alanine ligase, partial [Spirochaetota bacterium]|nr:UDP-N-acetylmuramoyl-tripeptide--D-alanyl-D-alanine ligase [Spirochaetota bacterium]
MIVQFETSSVTIARAIGAKHYGADMAVKHITTDSRLLDDKSLFVPIAGQKFDGHDFIEEACKSGKCSSVLTHKHTDVAIAERYGVSAIVCDDTLHAYMDIALWHRKNFDIPTIGITGTNGKTTTKEMIANVLESQGRVLKTEKNYNNEIGVPYTLLHLNKEHAFAVIEMGMNHLGEIHRLSLAAAPDVAVITNIGEGHLEFVGSTMNVAHAKAEILDGMNKGICIINNETKHKDIVINKANDKKIKVITFGLTGDIRPATFAVYADKTVVQYDGIDFVVYAYGFHNVYAMLATIAVAKVLGIPLNNVKESLECFKPVSMRSALHNGRCIIIDDSYNANPLSMEYAFASASMV